MAAADDLGSQWTGAITAYHLGTQALNYAFALSWLIYLRTGRPIFLAAKLFDCESDRFDRHSGN